MTEQELLQYVYAHLGGEEETGMEKPWVLAIAEISLQDFVSFLAQKKPDQAKKFKTSVSNQSWANSSFSAPTDMLFVNQRNFTRMDIGGSLVHQVESRNKIDLIDSSVTNHYYALEGKVFYIHHGGGTTSGSNLNLSYLKFPTISDLDLIDDELLGDYLTFVFDRISKTIYGQKYFNKSGSVEDRR